MAFPPFTNCMAFRFLDSTLLAENIYIYIYIYIYISPALISFRNRHVKLKKKKKYTSTSLYLMLYIKRQDKFNDRVSLSYTHQRLKKRDFKIIANADVQSRQCCCCLTLKNFMFLYIILFYLFFYFFIIISFFFSFFALTYYFDGLHVYSVVNVYIYRMLAAVVGYVI